MVFFFFWESRLDEKTALLPSKVWRIPGFGGFVALGLLPYAWWGTTQLQNSVRRAAAPPACAETDPGGQVVWQLVNGYSPILVAARMLPQGLAGLVVGGALSSVPVLQSVRHLLLGTVAEAELTASAQRPKINVPIGVILAIVGLILIILADFGRGNDYWRYDFTGFTIGSSGTVLTFLSGNNGLIMACPPEMAGVAGRSLLLSWLASTSR